MKITTFLVLAIAVAASSPISPKTPGGIEEEMTSFSEFLTDFDPHIDDVMSNERPASIGLQRFLLNKFPKSPYTRPAMMSKERRGKPVKAFDVTSSRWTYRKPQESDFDTLAPETPPASPRAVFKMNDVIPNQSNYQRPRASDFDTLATKSHPATPRDESASTLHSSPLKMKVDEKQEIPIKQALDNSLTKLINPKSISIPQRIRIPHDSNLMDQSLISQIETTLVAADSDIVKDLNEEQDILDQSSPRSKLIKNVGSLVHEKFNDILSIRVRPTERIHKFYTSLINGHHRGIAMSTLKKLTNLLSLIQASSKNPNSTLIDAVRTLLILDYHFK